MNWDRLVIILHSELVSSADDTVNCQIASHILSNIREVRQCNIEEMASHCHVSISSISRFCRGIGLESFRELQEIMGDATFDFDLSSQQPTTRDRSLELAASVIDSLDLVSRSVDYDSIDQLVFDIRRYERVAIFGLLKAETAAMNLQSDLLVLGKKAFTKVAYKRQVEYLKGATDQDLVIIFSYKGTYFQHQPQPPLGKGAGKPKVYFITSGQDPRPYAYFDHVIRFESQQDYASHPFQLQFIANLISQSYAFSLTNEHR